VSGRSDNAFFLFENLEQQREQKRRKTIFKKNQNKSKPEKIRRGGIGLRPSFFWFYFLFSLFFFQISLAFVFRVAKMNFQTI